MKPILHGLAAALVLFAMSGSAIAQTTEPSGDDAVKLYNCTVVANSIMDVEGMKIPMKFTLHFDGVPEDQKDNLADNLPEGFSVESQDCQPQ